MRRVDSYDESAPVPQVGSAWVWEPKKPHARERIVITEVRWNGEEWWVKSSGVEGEYWNDLSRFWQAVGA